MKFFITSVLLSLSGYLLHHIVDAAESNPYSMTTLEQVINRAFVAKLEDRTWQRVFGQGSSGSYVLPDLLPQPICGGGSIEDWPLPASVADESKRESDLARVLESGVFTCGYLSNLIHETRTLNGDNTVLIGTNSTGYVWGIIPEFWQEMISFVSSELPAANAAAWNLQWKLYSTPQETLNALAAGEIDALCGSTYSRHSSYNRSASLLPFSHLSIYFSIALFKTGGQLERTTTRLTTRQWPEPMPFICRLVLCICKRSLSLYTPTILLV